MNSNHRVFGMLAIACFSLLSFSGCGAQPSSAGDAQTDQLPKMNFHKPENFAAAVTRIRAIHDTLISNDALPAAITYTVKEVSHSHGQEAAHVHYHLVDETADHDHGDHESHEHHDHDDDHGHDDHAHDAHGDQHDEGHDGHDHQHDEGHDDHDHQHAGSPDATHRITVDIFTEFNDIAKWLPAIASDGDLSRDSWNTSKDVSEKITSHLEKVGQSDQLLAQRKSYQDNSADVEKWIQEIEALIKPAAATTETK